MNTYNLIRPLLFQLDPEDAHHLTVHLLALAGRLPPARWLLQRLFPSRGDHTVHVLGMDFPNPVGLAAGYDKDGRALPGLACLGFGFLEAGTVTPRPQTGNPRPRVYRLPEHRAVINHMGFPNAGAGELLRRVRRLRDRQPDLLHGVRLGINIGKNTDTPMEASTGDYIQLLHMFAPYADYIAVNVSCPNLSGLSGLQGRAELEGLLGALVRERSLLEGAAWEVPLVVKISPDLGPGELEDAVGACLDQGVEGIIATNTTTGRNGLPADVELSGGLSGAPLEQRSTEVVRQAAKLAGGKLAVIGVGGIFDADGARAKLDAGADLVQVYTGMIYRGPGMVRKIVSGMGGNVT